jgi:thioredoxin reductase
MTATAVPEAGGDRVDIAIVGGGISGLYSALQLAQCIADRKPLFVGGRLVDYATSVPSIGLYEMRSLFGGRIET